MPSARVDRRGLGEERVRFLRAVAIVVVATEADIRWGDDDAGQLLLSVIDGEGQVGGTIQADVESQDEGLELHRQADNRVVLVGG